MTGISLWMARSTSRRTCGEDMADAVSSNSIATSTRPPHAARALRSIGSNDARQKASGGFSFPLPR